MQGAQWVRIIPLYFWKKFFFPVDSFVLVRSPIFVNILLSLNFFFCTGKVREEWNIFKWAVKHLSCSRHRTTKFPNSESPIFCLLAWSNSRARHDLEFENLVVLWREQERNQEVFCSFLCCYCCLYRFLSYIQGFFFDSVMYAHSLNFQHFILADSILHRPIKDCIFLYRKMK